MASQALIKDFEDLLGKENVFSSEADRASYSYDSAVLPAVMPALVVRPTTAEQLGQCVKKLYDNGIPMTVRGSGTNLSGGTIPDKSDTVVILTTGLNRILEINSDDLYAVVEPGVITAQFAAAVAKKNLFYPPDPGSQAVSTIGGNIAENAGGLRGLKYGVTKDYFMGVEFFDSTGALVKSGSRTVKCVTGYNLTGLMIQSEGTLGVISQAVLKLVPPPKASRACMAVFPDVQSAAQAVAGIIAASNNHIGVVGLAYNVKLMPIKAGMASGFFNQSQIAKGILYAYNNGADVINMSFGGSASTIAVQDALETAYTRCVLVAAAGNDGAPNEGLLARPTYPAALSYVMGVMSVDIRGVESGFTNYDVVPYNSVEYEVYAPGSQILSTIPGNRYATWSGTSMAAPYVSAMAALLRSAYPDTNTYPTKFIYQHQSLIIDQTVSYNSSSH